MIRVCESVGRTTPSDAKPARGAAVRVRKRVRRRLPRPEGERRKQAAAVMDWQSLYPRLRQQARRLMARERAGHTLQPTALVHEGIIRIFRQWKSPQTEEELLAAMAVNMRRVLVDSVRRKRSQKRGGHLGWVDLSIDQVADLEPREDLIAIDAALDRLEAVDAEAARVVVLRYFGGMTGAEISCVVGVSPRSVDRLWGFARSWLLRELRA